MRIPLQEAFDREIIHNHDTVYFNGGDKVSEMWVCKCQSDDAHVCLYEEVDNDEKEGAKILVDLSNYIWDIGSKTIIPAKLSSLTDEFHCYECHTNWPSDEALTSHKCEFPWLKQVLEDQEIHNAEGVTVRQLYAVLHMAIQMGEGDGPVQICGIAIDGELAPLKFRLAGITAGTDGVQLMDVKKPTPIKYLWQCQCTGGCDRRLWIKDGELLTNSITEVEPEIVTHIDHMGRLNGKYQIMEEQEITVRAIIATYYETKINEVKHGK